ncbi:MAG: hypothetical protein AAB445_01385 [Patescibacteria group bacterium]
MDVPATTQGKKIDFIYKKNDAAAGLSLQASEFTRTNAQSVLDDEHRLAQKPYGWLEEVVKLLYGQQPQKEQNFEYGRLIALWERAVQNQLFVAQRDIANAIQNRSMPLALPFPLPEVKIYIVGTGEVMLHSCPLPLCCVENVAYRPVLPKDLHTDFFDRFKRIPPINGCDHRIPVPEHAQRIIANALAMYKMKRGSTSNVTEE